MLQLVECSLDEIPLPVQFPGGSFLLLLGGMTAVAPPDRIANILLLSYPLSASTAPVSIPSSRGMAWGPSDACPPVSVNRILGVAHHVYLGGQSAARAAQRLTLAPPFTCPRVSVLAEAQALTK